MAGLSSSLAPKLGTGTYLHRMQCTSIQHQHLGLAHYQQIRVPIAEIVKRVRAVTPDSGMFLKHCLHPGKRPRQA